MGETILRDYYEGRKCIAVVGIGYVGLPLCIRLGKVFQNIIGFDTNVSRIKELRDGRDKNKEVSREELLRTSVTFTADPSAIGLADIIIVAVPTPIDAYKMPDLRPIQRATEIIGNKMKAGVIVVYESTFYPGVTEGLCGPILEATSGLRCGVEFKLGYSPERVSPGDKEHTFEKIIKVVSGQDEATTDMLCALYGAIVEAGIYRAPNIKTAEAAKVIENVQRDLNIALMNELSIIFEKLGLDTNEVIAAAKTKWNFIPFEPGLVGGHCISVDPYYLTFKAQELGYRPEVILAGRWINDNMGNYIAEQTIKEIVKSNGCCGGLSILILGFTFKENLNDIRNTKVIDIYKRLREFGVMSYIYDPISEADDVFNDYGLHPLDRLDAHAPYDGIILAVKHDVFKTIEIQLLRSLCRGNPVFIDVKSFFPREAVIKHGFHYWRL